MKKINVSLVASFLLATNLYSQTTTLETITVTSATKSEQKLKDVTANVDVITAEDIEARKFKKEEKMKRYFSFFGILMATSNAKFNMFYSKFDNYLEKLPNIKNSLIKTELKPIKQYSTNNL